VVRPAALGRWSGEGAAVNGFTESPFGSIPVRAFFGDAMETTLSRHYQFIPVRKPLLIFFAALFVMIAAPGLVGAQTPSWTQLTTFGRQPNARAGHSAVYDAAADNMIIFGGANCVQVGVGRLRFGVMAIFTVAVPFAPRESSAVKVIVC
jgi:hypothetical protein